MGDEETGAGTGQEPGQQEGTPEEGGAAVEETTTTTETTPEDGGDTPPEEPTEQQEGDTPPEEQPAQTDEPSEHPPGWEGTRDAATAEPDSLNEQGGARGIQAEVDPETGKQGPPSDPPPSTATEPITREDR